MTDVEIEAEVLTPEQETRIKKITDSLDRDNLATLEASHAGDLMAVNYNQLLEISKTMAMAKFGIPPHLRGNPGDCLAIREIALNMGLSPYRLAQHSYVVKGMLAFDGQAIHAMVEMHAKIEQRLRYNYAGEFDKGTRTCTVTGTFRGEVDPVEYTTPEIGKISPKNSPLWQSDPDQQLAYFAVRRWARKYCPDVLLGVYSKDELEDSNIGAERAKDVTPNLMERLPGKVEGAAGFAENVVDATLQKPAPTKKKKTEQPKPKTPEPEPEPTPKKADSAPPKNRKQYDAHVAEWVVSYNNADDIVAHWKMERSLRNQCGLVSEETADIKAKYVDKRIEQLKDK